MNTELIILLHYFCEVLRSTNQELIMLALV